MNSKNTKVHEYVNTNQCISVATICTLTWAFSNTRCSKVAIKYTPCNHYCYHGWRCIDEYCSVRWIHQQLIQHHVAAIFCVVYPALWCCIPTRTPSVNLAVQSSIPQIPIVTVTEVACGTHSPCIACLKLPKGWTMWNITHEWQMSELARAL